ncbi:hypothetical protein H2200_010136 [Cladophialophora chaetospira]|uniref:DUF3669 domain-containing protein n=1 Tax=Cladophialophora chaetospira TaxID=386627 RepID=A0AA39CEQ6_9EURO|nr:hypothetical protein H2200_010136 [Cladophialophora chaetospira]
MASYEADTLKPFIKIGNGSFGIIFADPAAPVIYKRELWAGDKSCPWTITEEYALHVRISKAFHKWSPQHRPGSNEIDLQVQIPEPQEMMLKDAAWWTSNAARFPAVEPQYQRPAPMLEAERILTLPRNLRQQLIDTFCPPPSRLSATREQHEVCLIRLYLGRQSRRKNPNANPYGLGHFSIRNFPGYVDQLETLGLDTQFIAAHLGKALAVLHFEALTDARDVEFVLGAARSPKLATSQTTTTEPTPPVTPLPTPTTESFPHEHPMTDIRGPTRALSIWCLDFNQCQRLSYATPSAISSSMSHCINAYFSNDPYYPRPDQTELWATFKTNYEKMANEILRKQRAQETDTSQEATPPNVYTALWNHPNPPEEFTRAIERRFWKKAPTQALELDDHIVSKTSGERDFVEAKAREEWAGLLADIVVRVVFLTIFVCLLVHEGYVFARKSIVKFIVKGATLKGLEVLSVKKKLGLRRDKSQSKRDRNRLEVVFSDHEYTVTINGQTFKVKVEGKA